MTQPNHKPKRPFSVTILAFGVLSFVLLQLTRMVSGFQQRQFLASLPLSIPPVYFVITGLVWAAIGLVNLYRRLVRQAMDSQDALVVSAELLNLLLVG